MQSLFIMKYNNCMLWITFYFFSACLFNYMPQGSNIHVEKKIIINKVKIACWQQGTGRTNKKKLI